MWEVHFMKSSSEYHFILVSETHGFELRLLTISCLSFRYKRYLKYCGTLK